MKIKKNSAFTLIETMIALVISVIAVGAIYYSYLFFKSSYQVILDKAAMSDSGRVSLSVISKDLRNAGYKDINFSRAFDRKIEHVDRYNGKESDSLVVWYNTSPSENEIKNIVIDAIKDSNATKINEMGKVMSLVMKIGGDQIDGKIANKFVRELLS